MKFKSQNSKNRQLNDKCPNVNLGTQSETRNSKLKVKVKTQNSNQETSSENQNSKLEGKLKTQNSKLEVNP